MEHKIPHFKIPLNLPHAGTISERISRLLERFFASGEPKYDRLLELSNQLTELLWAYHTSGENPLEAEGMRVRNEAAQIGRAIVNEIESLQIGSDRLGQCVRNLFECLELGEEGATISLRAGENPNSLQRPS